MVENPLLLFAPDPYALNPFRILEVGVDASLETIARKVERIEKQLHAGKQPTRGISLEEGQAHGARRALEEPLHRLFFEIMHLSTQAE